MGEKREKFLIFDGNALVHRAFHALPPLTTKDGQVVNAVYGFVSILIKVLKEFSPQYAAVTFDTAAPTFRDEAFAEYKATRIKQPQDLYDQFPVIKELLKAFGIPIFEVDGYEADDLIGTLAKKVRVTSPEIDVVIVTGDLDTLQLVDARTSVYTMRKGIGDTVQFDIDAVQTRFGFEPKRTVDYKALRGDPSDNIPGVKGIGEKTAIELIKKYGTLDDIYRAVDSGNADKELSSKVVDALRAHKKDAYLSYTLAAIVQDAPLDADLASLRVVSPDREKVVDLFQRLEFKSLLPRLPALWGAKTPLHKSLNGGEKEIKVEIDAKHTRMGDQRYETIDSQGSFNEFLTLLEKSARFAVDTETTGLDPLVAELLGASFSLEEGRAYYVVLRDSAGKVRDKWIRALAPVLENPDVAKVGHNMKFDCAVFRTAGISMRGLTFDTMVASYLLNPGSRQHSLANSAFSEFGYEMMPLEALIGKKGKGQIAVSDVPTEKLSWYSCEDADITFRLAERYEPQLVSKQLLNLFETIEMPLIPVLEDMERTGVLVDVSLLKTMRKSVGEKIARLQEEIFKHAGEEFNVKSPLQLKHILFEKLNLASRTVRSTKTGLSTAASELEKLKDLHPIVPLIMEFRELEKLRSTYIDALPKLVGARTRRVHTSFNQTVTATGRLSSSDPNLQNIPIRTPLGRDLRRAFVAPKGSVLLSADYSQIELRIIASLAKDERMMDAFASGDDIHRRTAAEIFEREPEEVTDSMRRDAKTINFGIIYGMGSIGLAAATGMQREAAQAFIDKYFQIYHGVASYLEDTKKFAQEEGYVETLFGRRRYLPELASDHPMLRSAAEREAINMPVQGTAADLIKLAMIAVHRKIQSEGKGDIRMILQVHDELVFEVKETALEHWAKMVKGLMEGVHALRVPIEVNLKSGKNWGEMETV